MASLSGEVGALPGVLIVAQPGSSDHCVMVAGCALAGAFRTASDVDPVAAEQQEPGTALTVFWFSGTVL